MGHSKEILNRTDPNYLYLANHVTVKEDKKPYVFISYKSDDDKTVLSTIVYHLVKEKGLRVYFDASFDEYNDIWVKQFQKNMESSHCKGVIAFISNNYTVSYATLMELMHSQSTLVTENKDHPSGTGHGIPVVPVNLEELSDFDDNELEKDTGLGKQNGNPNAILEREVFDEDFNDLVKLKTIVLTSRLGKKDELTWRDCNCIFKELYGKLGINSNKYDKDNKGFYEALEKTIRNGIGNEVFDKIDNKDEKVVVKFLFDNEEKEFEIIKGNRVDAIDPGEKDGYTFVGWFDTACNQKWDFSVPVEKSITLESKWEKISMPLGFINENMSLESFSKLCEDISFCAKLREVRNTCKKQIFDFFVASLLRGCDNKVEEKGPRKGAYNYCVYVISEKTDFETPKLGASQYTWESNSRKAMRKEDMPESYFNEQGKIKSGTLGEYSEIFEKLSPELTIGSLLEKYRSEEKGFRTKDNGSIIDSWEKIKTINIGDSKFGIPF